MKRFSKILAFVLTFVMALSIVGVVPSSAASTFKWKGISNKIAVGQKIDPITYFDASTEVASRLKFTTNTPEIVTINQGKLVGMKEGKGTLITTDTKTGESERHTIIVMKEVTWKGNNKLMVGETLDPLNCYTINLPSQAKTLKFEITDGKDVAKIEDNKIVGLKEGTAKFKTTNSETGFSETHSVNVIGTRLSWIGNNTVKYGQTLDPTKCYSVTPADRVSDLEFEITEGTDIAKIENGQIVGLKVGTAKFKTTVKGTNISEIHTINVIEDGKELTWNGGAKICIGQTLDPLTCYTVDPADRAKNLVFEMVDNNGVAKVENNKIVGLKAGTAKFKTTDTVTGVTDTQTVEVVKELTWKGNNKVAVNGTLDPLTCYTVNIPSRADKLKFEMVNPNDETAKVEDNKIVGLKEGSTEFFTIDEETNLKEKHTVIVVGVKLTWLGNNTVTYQQTLDPKGCYTVEPAEAADKLVFEMADKNDKIAKVENNKIVGLKVGSTKFVTTYTDEETGYKYSETHTVNVVEDGKELTWKDNGTICIGQKIDPASLYIVTPSDRKANLVFKTEDSSIAKIEDGQLVGVKTGTTKLTTTDEVTGVTDTQTIKVVKEVSWIGKNKVAIDETLDPFDCYTVNVPSRKQYIKFEMVDPNNGVAKVVDNKIVGIKAGDAEFYTIDEETGLKEKHTVRVIGVKLTWKEGNNNKICVGETLDPLSCYTVDPEDKAKDLVFTMEDPNNGIAKIENNKIVGLKEGKTTFVTTDPESKYSEKHTVEVVKEATWIGNNKVAEGGTLDPLTCYTVNIPSRKDKLTFTITEGEEYAKIVDNKIVGIKAGTAKFVTTDKETGFTETHSVRVVGVHLTWKANNNKLCPGMTIDPLDCYTVDPEDKAKDLVFTMEDPNNGIAKIENNKIVGLKEGKTTFVTTDPESKYSEKHTVEVVKEATWIGNNKVAEGATLDPLTCYTVNIPSRADKLTFTMTEEELAKGFAKIEDNKIVGIKAGTVQFITTDKETGFTETHSVKVVGVHLTWKANNNKLCPGMTIDPLDCYTVDPEEKAKDLVFTMADENDEIAKVVDNKIVGLKEGSTKFVTTDPESGYTETHTIEVVKEATWIGNNRVNVGETLDPLSCYTVNIPSRADKLTFTMTDPDDKIAKIKNNRIVGLSEGITTFVTEDKETGFKETHQVIVIDNVVPVTPTMTIHNANEFGSMVVGTEKLLDVTMTPDGDVTYTSADDKIASVAENGLVKAEATGTTKITVTSKEYPTVSKTVEVTVKEYLTKATFIDSDEEMTISFGGFTWDADKAEGLPDDIQKFVTNLANKLGQDSPVTYQFEVNGVTYTLEGSTAGLTVKRDGTVVDVSSIVALGQVVPATVKVSTPQRYINHFLKVMGSVDDTLSYDGKVLSAVNFKGTNFKFGAENEVTITYVPTGEVHTYNFFVSDGELYFKGDVTEDPIMTEKLANPASDKYIFSNLEVVLQ